MRLLPLLALLLLAADPAAAQLALGGQVGDPTGLSLKAGAGRGALLLAVGWDLDESVTAEGHYVLRSRRLEGTSRVALFYGPGLFAKIDDDRDDDRFGVSFGVGLETLLTPDVELYGLLSPRLILIDDTDFDLGAGLGLRLRL